MPQEIFAAIRDLFGTSEGDLNAVQMALRALVIYLSALAMVRLGEKRFMGKNTAFDVILGFMLGSVLGRAITGNSPFAPTMAAGVTLVILHYLFSTASYHSEWFGHLIKGSARTLVTDGRIHRENMRKSHVGTHDLESALYRNGKVTEVEQVRIARFERNGEISIIPRPKQPKVVEVSLKGGVQTVRIEFSAE